MIEWDRDRVYQGGMFFLQRMGVRYTKKRVRKTRTKRDQQKNANIESEGHVYTQPPAGFGVPTIIAEKLKMIGVCHLFLLIYILVSQVV